MSVSTTSDANGFWRAVCGESRSHGSEGAGGKSAGRQRPVTRPPSTLFFLLHLGLIGDEFKTARQHLLAVMPGNAAWKNGPPKPEVKPAAETAEVCNGTN